MNRNITAGILIILAVGLYFSLTKGYLAEARAVKAVNDQYASAIDNAARLVSVRDKVLKQYNNISADDRDRLDKMIPSTIDNIRLIIDLNGVALKHGLSLKGIKANTSKAVEQTRPAVAPAARSGSGASLSREPAVISQPTLDSVTVSFSVTAPYLDFISFMQDLEASLRVMDLTHLSVAANDTGTYDFGVELRTYWLRQ